MSVVTMPPVPNREKTRSIIAIVAYLTIIAWLFLNGVVYSLRPSAVEAYVDAPEPVLPTRFVRIAVDDNGPFTSSIVTVRDTVGGKCYAYATRTGAVSPLIEVACK